MRILVTGSSGHLGEALVRVLRAEHDVVGLDLLPSPHTDVVGSVADGEPLRAAMEGADAVLHTATLHKPHVGTHSRAAFVQTNIVGTLAVLEQAVAAGVGRVVMTSTTSAYGRALTRPGAATWIDEDVRPLPRNVYGVTKTAAEDLCELVARDTGLPVVVLRTSRFFSESDDREEVRAAYSTDNAQVNELLSRRVDLEDVVAAHRCAMERAPVAAVTVWSAGPGKPGLLEPMGVHREHRGHGYGKAITIAAAAALQELGSSSAIVCAPSANVGAVATYKSAGFQQLPETRDQYRDA